jgi:hypothetical protein
MRKRRGVKARWLLIIALCLLCWTGAPNYNSIKSEDKIMYGIFENRFTEPIEVMYFLMNDMRLFKVTSNHENKVSFVLPTLVKEFKQNGYDISDVIVIIHNHTKRAYFSNSDIVIYRLFRGMGFDGKFYIYVYRTKSIYELAERLR